MSAVESFISTFFVIVTSEIGDKSFLLAAVLATCYGKRTVFVAVFSALVFMTAMAGLIGTFSKSYIFALPKSFVGAIACLTYLIIGLHMVNEGLTCWTQSNNTSNFTQDSFVKSSLRETKEEKKAVDLKTEDKKRNGFVYCGFTYTSTIVKVFLMACAAELGDKSQITTVMLGATKDTFGLLLGGAAGHAFCTGVAVIGGNAIASNTSVHLASCIGGFILLMFSAAIIWGAL